MAQPVSLRKRQPELDIIRIVAFCGVIWLHCLLYIGFYTQLPKSPGYLTALAIRTLLSITIPLFIMLTGYLLCEKSLSSTPLKGLGKVLLLYVLTCVPVYFFRQVEEPGYHLSPAGFCWTILDYSLNHYGWYIGMYIGLFLLAPYLNVLISGLDQKGNRRLLILLFVLISLPTLTNTLRLFNLEFWLHPSTVEGGFNQLLPEFWQDLPHPLLYYGMGAYFRRYPPRVQMRTLLGSFLGAWVLFSAYNLWRLDGRPFYVNIWNNSQGFQPVVLTPLFFSLPMRFFAGRIHREKTVRILSWVSSLTLGACLLSYCSDMILYRVLNLTDHFSSFREAILFSPVLVLASGSLALLMSIPATWMVQTVMRLLAREVSKK